MKDSASIPGQITSRPYTSGPDALVPSNSRQKASCSGQSRSEEHTSELQSHLNLVCRLLLEKKKEYILCSRPNYLYAKLQHYLFMRLCDLIPKTTPLRSAQVSSKSAVHTLHHYM